MTDEQKKTLITYRMDRARESLQAAQLLFDNNMLIPAMNRLYYAMFYAVLSLLVLHDATFSKHGQVKGFFNREFIKSGVLPVQLGKLYNTMFEYRQKYDYVDFSVPESSLVADYLKKTAQFLDQIEIFLRHKLRK